MFSEKCWKLWLWFYRNSLMNRKFIVFFGVLLMWCIRFIDSLWLVGVCYRLVKVMMWFFVFINVIGKCVR